MKIFAEINSDNIVKNVIVCEDSGVPSEFVGTFVECTEETRIASIGDSYDVNNDKFISQKPYESWTLNSDLEWESPVGPKPDGFYKWIEDSQEWVPLS